MTDPAGITMAERKRRLVAGELTESALQLLVSKGFEAVTVDEITTAAGVSKRTFFRYFESKEDVVVQFLAEMGTRIHAELAARPIAEPPSVAWRHAVWVPIAACGDHADRALRVVQLILRTPALRSRFLERQVQWHRDLTAQVARRHDLDPDRDLYPRMAAGMALTAFNTVLQCWSDSDGAADPADLTDRAFAVIIPGLDSRT
ncbi:acyl-CoA-like ligand-binding transcription factor [Nocardia sp. NBC_01329]|uniref:acyl-CoA-like ligand-binding transcription factor n=1 Tax=Nocardia sp. NBC_01329 TaxID=2903594 RepID=UPI002E0F164A|nr:TetR family transcriptional regulator [Nocardia sp. NBC_01329]